MILCGRHRSCPSAPCGTKINSSDPSLTAVCTAYATPPLLPFFHPTIELAAFRPVAVSTLIGGSDFPAICLGTLLQVVVVEIHV
jgi:hypothetical protein